MWSSLFFYPCQWKVPESLSPDALILFSAHLSTYARGAIRSIFGKRGSLESVGCKHELPSPATLAEKWCGRTRPFPLMTGFRLPVGSSSSRHPNQVTPKKSGLKNGQMKSKDDECFGDDIDEIPDTDFDFEGNLALFDKAAVFEEIETYERRSGTRSRGTPSEKPARYRHDENILESEPIVYRRIVVPQNANKEFCTGMPRPFLVRRQTQRFAGVCVGGCSPQGVSVSLTRYQRGHFFM